MTDKSSSQLYREAYTICAAFRALHAVRELHSETGAIERMERDLMRRSATLGITLHDLWVKYDTYVRDSENHRALMRIESGEVDHAIVKFPAGVMQKPFGKLTVTADGERFIDWNGQVRPGIYDFYPCLTPVAEGVTVREQVMERPKKILAQGLRDAGYGAPNWSPKNPLEAFDTPKPKVVSLVVHRGQIEQVIFNLAHGLPDGVYELVKG